MITPKTKFCMFCQRNIPDDSVCCPYCCQRQPSGGVAGQTKKCVNCSVMLPASARFCKSCGREQPATAKSTDDKTPTSTTPKPTDVKTPTATAQPKPTDVKTPTPTTPKPTDDKTPVHQQQNRPMIKLPVPQNPLHDLRLAGLRVRCKNA